MRAGTEPWRSRTKARYELMLQASRDPELVDAFDQNLDLFTQLHRDIVIRLQPPGRAEEAAMKHRPIRFGISYFACPVGVRPSSLAPIIEKVAGA
jgi:hypothetical protein